MSRAFVREQDEPGVEPLPELAVSSAPNWVTKRGFAQIEKHLEDIDSALAKSPSDEDAARLHRDKRYWMARRGTAKIVDPPAASSDEAGFGSRVTIKRGDHKPEVLEIVGEDEADIDHGKISFAAPIGHALIGKRAGDVVTVGARKPPIEIEVIKVVNGAPKH
jgi:transcription elongation GreA/GreB family factor